MVETKEERITTMKVCVIDDDYAMGRFAEQFLPNHNITHLRRIPDDVSILSSFDVLIVDGNGIANKEYANGLDFCKAYTPSVNNRRIVFYSGNGCYGKDLIDLAVKGIVPVTKGCNPDLLKYAVEVGMDDLL